MNYSVFTELDPESVNYIELFIVTMEKLFDVVEKYNFRIRPEYLEKIKLWDSSKEIQSVKEKHFSAEIEGGSETNFGVPYFQKLFAKLKATAKSSRSFKETLKTEIEPRFSELRDNCNQLITEVRLQLHKINKDNLIIIIEDLDKINLESAKSIFLDHAGQLTQLEANVIYTFPIALYYSSQFNTIKAFFSDCYELPMIKVREKDGAESAEGIGAMHRIVEARMNVTLFDSPSILHNMILMSGGCLRDLFLLIRESSNWAHDEDRDTICEQDYQRALQGLINDYQNTLTDEKIEEEYYPVEKFYEVLVKLAKTGEYENSLLMLKLRQTLCVLGYNGEYWCAIHPVVKQILINKNYFRWDQTRQL